MEEGSLFFFSAPPAATLSPSHSPSLVRFVMPGSLVTRLCRLRFPRTLGPQLVLGRASSSLSSFAHVPLVRVSCAKPRSGLVAPGLLASFSPSSAVQAAGSARSSWTHVRLYASAAARGAGTLSDPDEDEGLDDDVDLVSALESEIEHEDEAEKDGDGSEDEFESLMGVLKSEFGFTLAKDDAGDAEIVLTKKENGEEITLMLQSDGDMDAGGEDGEEPEDEDDLAFETEGVTAVLAVKKGKEEVQFDVAFKGDEDFPEVRRVAFVESGKGGMMGMMDINAITSSPYNGPDFETLDERLQVRR